MKKLSYILGIVSVLSLILVLIIEINQGLPGISDQKCLAYHKLISTVLCISTNLFFIILTSVWIKNNIEEKGARKIEDYFDFGAKYLWFVLLYILCFCFLLILVDDWVYPIMNYAGNITFPAYILIPILLLHLGLSLWLSLIIAKKFTKKAN